MCVCVCVCVCVSEKPNLPCVDRGSRGWWSKQVIYRCFSGDPRGGADALLDDDDDGDESRARRKKKRLSSVISNAASMILKSLSFRSWGVLIASSS